MMKKHKKELAALWARRLEIPQEERADFKAPAKYTGKNVKLSIIWGSMVIAQDKPVLAVLGTLSFILLGVKLVGQFLM